MEIPDLSSQTYLLHPEDGYTYLSVGWLGTRVVNPSETPYDILYLLREIEPFNQLRDPCLGPHICETCGLFCTKRHDPLRSAEHGASLHFRASIPASCRCRRGNTCAGRTGKPMKVRGTQCRLGAALNLPKQNLLYAGLLRVLAIASAVLFQRLRKRAMNVAA
jgi:hypothetical protein